MLRYGDGLPPFDARRHVYFPCYRTNSCSSRILALTADACRIWTADSRHFAKYSYPANLPDPLVSNTDSRHVAKYIHPVQPTHSILDGGPGAPISDLLSTADYRHVAAACPQRSATHAALRAAAAAVGKACAEKGVIGWVALAELPITATEAARREARSSEWRKLSGVPATVHGGLRLTAQMWPRPRWWR